ALVLAHAMVGRAPAPARIRTCHHACASKPSAPPHRLAGARVRPARMDVCAGGRADDGFALGPGPNARVRVRPGLGVGAFSVVAGADQTVNLATPCIVRALDATGEVGSLLTLALVVDLRA